MGKQGNGLLAAPMTSMRAEPFKEVKPHGKLPETSGKEKETSASELHRLEGCGGWGPSELPGQDHDGWGGGNRRPRPPMSRSEEPSG